MQMTDLRGEHLITRAPLTNFISYSEDFGAAGRKKLLETEDVKLSPDLSKRKLAVKLKDHRSLGYHSPATGSLCSSHCLQCLLTIAGYTETHPCIISRLMSP